ncbi:phage tail sheath subtilisin-like domain-containing protein [Nodosilinea sp. FACHB-13]|nr:phage tail sheath subtilisin-like domain-containing protein [Nodosilinea sp. FACHB-13]
MPEMILPGTYVEVRDEGLISAGRISTGNIGIVGTASQGSELGVVLIGSLSEARAKFGGASDGLTLIRSLELVYQNGGKNVYAVCTGTCSECTLNTTITENDKEVIVGGITLQANHPGKQGDALTVKVAEGSAEAIRLVELKQGKITESYPVSSLADLEKAVTAKSQLVRVAKINADYKDNLPNLLTAGNFKGGVDPNYKQGLEALEKDAVNIVVLAGQHTGDSEMLTHLVGHLTQTAGIRRERIGIMGLGFAMGKKGPVPDDVPVNDRLILVAPGVAMKEKPDSEEQSPASGYLAAAVAGLISSLPVHTSPTNKTLAVDGLTDIYNSATLEQLVQKRLLAVEQRDGFRIVKGITTHDGAWRQITTRRIVDYAIYGVRSSCNPYIGKLNNVRVRGAMKATLNGFLSRMVEDEALVGYQLEVSATRDQEVAGEAIVAMTLQPTFSIDFVKVTMSLS